MANGFGDMSKFPDFYVIGPPKCGTTSLYEYMRAHDLIFVPDMKEIHYFSSDFSERWRRIHTESQYLRLYEDAGPGQLRGDFSVTYLSSAVAIEKILRANPKSKFIALLRDPITAVPSYHSQVLYSVLEDIQDPHEAWLAQIDRKNGRRLPSTCREKKLLLYREMFDYPKQLKRLHQLVPSEQRLVLIFERFVQDTLRNYIDILDFLNVPYDGRRSFEIANPNKVARYYSLERALRHPPFPFNHLKNFAKEPLNRLGLHPISRLRAFNRRVAKRKPISAAFRAELIRAFSGDKKKVERILGMNLSEWL